MLVSATTENNNMTTVSPYRGIVTKHECEPTENGARSAYMSRWHSVDFGMCPPVYGAHMLTARRTVREHVPLRLS